MHRSLLSLRRIAGMTRDRIESGGLMTRSPVGDSVSVTRDAGAWNQGSLHLSSPRRHACMPRVLQ
jgi:hypothetical protein